MTPVVAKPWYLSKTLVVNAVTLIALAIGLVLQNAGALHLDPQTGIWITIGLATVNALLRIVTNSAIEGTPAANSAVPPSAAPAASTQPTLDDLPGLVAQLKQRRDSDDALLAQLARAASPAAPTAVTPPAAATSSAPPA